MFQNEKHYFAKFEKKLKNFIFPKLKKYIFWIIVLKFFKKRKS